MENLAISEIEKNEILNLAKGIKESLRIKSLKLESERVQRVNDLLDTIESIKPEESRALFEELKKISKSIDFVQYHILTKESFLNVVYYDGSKVHIFKQNGEISVKSLPKNVFIDIFKADLANYFKVGVLSAEYIESETKYSLTAKECFELWQNEQLNKTKISGSYDTNLTNIYKRELELKALKTANRSKDIIKPFAKVKRAKK